MRQSLLLGASFGFTYIASATMSVPVGVAATIVTAKNTYDYCIDEAYRNNHTRHETLKTMQELLENQKKLERLAVLEAQQPNEDELVVADAE